MNTPYIKQTDSLGTCQNPITKENPYLTVFPNRKMRRNKPPRFKARYGKQFIQTVYTFTDSSGNVIKQDDVINHLNLTVTKKQVVHTRNK